MDFILYVDNVPKEILYRENDILAFFKQTSSMQNLSTLWELLEQKVILQRDFEDLRKNLKVVKETAALASFRWVENSIIEHLETAEDFIYLKRKTVDLQLFLDDTIERWQEGWRAKEYEESAADLIKRTFQDIEYHGFDVLDSDNSMTLAEVVCQEVVDYYGGICWDNVALTLNDMNPFHRSEIDLQELMEMLYWSCAENC